MDKSTNQPADRADETKIDAIDYLFGSTRQKIPTAGLSVETWVIAIRRLIEESKPYLKYFGSFSEILDKHSMSQFLRPGTDKDVIYPEGITAKTRVMSITRFSDGLRGDWEDRKFITQRLGMSDSGVILLFTLCDLYQRPFGKGDRSIVKYSCEIMVVDDLELSDLIWKTHGRIADIVDCLHDVLAKDIEARQSRLDKLKTVLSTTNRWKQIMEITVFCKKCTASKNRFGSCPHCGHSGSE